MMNGVPATLLIKVLPLLETEDFSGHVKLKRLVTAQRSWFYNLIGKDSLIYPLFDLIARKHGELSNVQ